MHPNDTYRATPTRRRETKTIRVGARQRSASSPSPCSLSRWSLSISYLRISSQKQTHLILERGGYGFIPNPSDDAAVSEDIREAGTRLENHIQENSVCTWRMICWGCKHLYSSMQFTQLDVKHENICVCVQCNERFISCWRRETPHGETAAVSGYWWHKGRWIYTILVQNQEVNQEAAKPNQSWIFEFNIWFYF